MSTDEVRTLSYGDPLARELIVAVRSGDLETLGRRLSEQPGLASARLIGRRKGTWRTPLHLATDWPGYYPSAPRAVEVILDAGADVNADTGGDRPETALHWAASTDDVDVAQVLIDRGAHLETTGGSIGTPLDNAVGYGCFNVARLLVARGAVVDKLWHAAALGMLSRLQELDAEPAAVSQAFWHACDAGHRRAAEYLLGRGADLNFVPDYSDRTPLGAASSFDTRQQNVIEWLQQRGAGSDPRRPPTTDNDEYRCEDCD